MKSASGHRKSAHLGMPWGTACNRLRKMVLFDLLQRHGEATCYKCKQDITTVEELSIEHKQPWEGRDSELFWDLNNIAFSHRCCNTTEVLRGGKGAPRFEVPEGSAWCTRCKQVFSRERFSRNVRNWNGLQHECKICCSLRNKLRCADGAASQRE